MARYLPWARLLLSFSLAAPTLARPRARGESLNRELEIQTWSVGRPSPRPRSPVLPRRWLFLSVRCFRLPRARFLPPPPTQQRPSRLPAPQYPLPQRQARQLPPT